MADVLQVILLLMILFWLIGLKRSHDAALATSPGVGLDELRGEMRELRGSLDAIRDHLGEMQKDHEILDELEENVMEEWARVIEDKLGKRPVVVPCPSCGWKGGLEPNLLADEDTEYGCPNCGTITAVEVLREKYPHSDLNP